MKLQSLYGKSLFLRITAAVTNLIFIVTTVAWAEVPLPRISEGVLSQPQETRADHVDAVRIPSHLGQIVKSHQASAEKLLIHIQDAHANREAQRHIGEILAHLSQKYGIHLVHVEGASGNLHSPILASYPSDEARQWVANYLLDGGKLTGPEWVALTTQRDLRLFGIEDAALYERNRQAFLEALDFRQRDEEVLRELEALLRVVARYLLSDEASEYFGKRKRFADHEDSLQSYLHYLTGKAEVLSLSLEGYPVTRHFLELVRLESTIDYDKAEKEAVRLVRALRKVLSKREKDFLRKLYAEYRSQDLRREEFYEALRDLAAGRRPDGLSTEHLSRYFEYLRHLRQVTVDIFSEVERLEDEIQEQFLRGEDQIRFGKLMAYLEIYQKIFRFSLTQKDSEFFFSHRREFRAAEFAEFLKPLLARFHIEIPLPARLETLDGDLAKIERFYMLALERDRVLVTNALGEMDKRGDKAAVVITGGFHTPGMERTLREKGLSYLVIQPRMRGELDLEGDQRRYESSVRETPTEIEKFLKQAYFAPRSGAVDDPRYQLAARKMVPDDQTMGRIDAEMAKAASLGRTTLENVPSLQRLSDVANLHVLADVAPDGEHKLPSGKRLAREDRRVLRLLYGPYRGLSVYITGSDAEGKRSSVVVTNTLANDTALGVVIRPTGMKPREVLPNWSRREEIQLGNYDLSLVPLRSWETGILSDRLKKREEIGQVRQKARAASLGQRPTEALVQKLSGDFRAALARSQEGNIIDGKSLRSLRERLGRVESRWDADPDSIRSLRKQLNWIKLLNRFHRRLKSLSQQADLLQAGVTQLERRKVEGLSREDLKREVQELRRVMRILQVGLGAGLSQFLTSTAGTPMEAYIQKRVEEFDGQYNPSTLSNTLDETVRSKRREWRAYQKQKATEAVLEAAAEEELAIAPELPPVKVMPSVDRITKPEPELDTALLDQMFSQGVIVDDIDAALADYGLLNSTKGPLAEARASALEQMAAGALPALSNNTMAALVATQLQEAGVTSPTEDDLVAALARHMGVGQDAEGMALIRTLLIPLLYGSIERAEQAARTAGQSLEAAPPVAEGKLSPPVEVVKISPPEPVLQVPEVAGTPSTGVLNRVASIVPETNLVAPPDARTKPSSSASFFMRLGTYFLGFLNLLLYPFAFIGQGITDLWQWLSDFFEASPPSRRRDRRPVLAGVEVLDDRTLLSGVFGAIGDVGDLAQMADFEDALDRAAYVATLDTGSSSVGFDSVSLSGTANHQSLAIGSGGAVINPQPVNGAGISVGTPLDALFAGGLMDEIFPGAAADLPIVATDNAISASLSRVAFGAPRTAGLPSGTDVTTALSSGVGASTNLGRVIGPGLPPFNIQEPNGALATIADAIDQLRSDPSRQDQLVSFAINIFARFEDVDSNGQIDFRITRPTLENFDANVERAYRFLDSTSPDAIAFARLITGQGLDGTPLQPLLADITSDSSVRNFAMFHFGRLYDSNGDGSTEMNFGPDAVRVVDVQTGTGIERREYQSPARVAEGLRFMMRPEAFPVADYIGRNFQPETAAMGIRDLMTDDPTGGRRAGVATQIFIHGRLDAGGNFLYLLDLDGNGVPDERDGEVSTVPATAYARTIVGLADLSNEPAQIVGNFFAGRVATGTVQEGAYNLLLNDRPPFQNSGFFFSFIAGLGDANSDGVMDRLYDRDGNGVVDPGDLRERAIPGSRLAFDLRAFGNVNDEVAQEIGLFATSAVDPNSAAGILLHAMKTDLSFRTAGFIEAFLRNIFDYDGDGATDFAFDGNLSGTVSRTEREDVLFRNGGLLGPTLRFLRTVPQAQIIAKFLAGDFAPPEHRLPADSPLARIQQAMLNDTTGGRLTGFISALLFRAFYDYRGADGVPDLVLDLNEDGNPENDTVILFQRMNRIAEGLRFLEPSNPDSDIFATFFAGDQVPGHQPLVRGGGLDIIRTAILNEIPDPDVAGRVIFFLVRTSVVVKDGVETLEFDPSIGAVLHDPLPRLAHVLRVLNRLGEARIFAQGILLDRIPAQFIKPGGLIGFFPEGLGSRGGGGGGGGGGGLTVDVSGGGGGGARGGVSGAGGSFFISERGQMAFVDDPGIQVGGTVIHESGAYEVFRDRDGNYIFREKVPPDQAEQVLIEMGLVQQEKVLFDIRLQIVARGRDYLLNVVLEQDNYFKLMTVPEGGQFPLRLGLPEAGEKFIEGRGDLLVIYLHLLDPDHPVDLDNDGEPDRGLIVIFNKKTKEFHILATDPSRTRVTILDDEGSYMIESEGQEEMERVPPGEMAEEPQEAGARTGARRVAGAGAQAQAPARQATRTLREQVDQIVREVRFWNRRLRLKMESKIAQGVVQVGDAGARAEPGNGTRDNQGLLEAILGYVGDDLAKDPVKAAVAASVAAAGIYTGWLRMARKRGEKAKAQVQPALPRPGAPRRDAKGQSLGRESRRGFLQRPVSWIRETRRWIAGTGRPSAPVESRRGFLKTIGSGGAAVAVATSGLGQLAARAQDWAAEAAKLTFERLVSLFVRREKAYRRTVNQANLTSDVRAIQPIPVRSAIEHVPPTAKLMYGDAVKRLFGDALNLPLDDPDTFTAADWDVKFLQPLIMVLGIDHPERFLNHFIANADDVKATLFSMQRQGIIRQDHDIPSDWKSWTGMAKVDEWVEINNQWKKMEVKGLDKPKFELDTLLGIALFLALSDYYKTWPGTYSEPRLSRNFFFGGLRASIDTGYMDRYTIGKFEEFKRFVGESYTYVFYSNMWNELGVELPQDRVGLGQIRHRVRTFQLARMVERAYPHLKLRGNEYHMLDQLDIAKPMLTAILGQKGFWPENARSIRDIMHPEVFLPIIEGLKRLNEFPILETMYKDHDDPMLKRILEEWKAGEFALVFGEGARVLRYPRSLAGLRVTDFDFKKTPPGFERKIRYLIAQRDASGGDSTRLRIYQLWIRDEVLQAAVGMDVGRKLFWIRYGMENGLVRPVRNREGKLVELNMSGLTRKLLNMQLLMPYVIDFYGIKDFNLNNPQHIGKLSSMESAMSRMKISIPTWNFILHVSSQREVREEVKALLSAVTGDENWRKREFDFEDPANGPDQVGAIMGWVMDRLREGWDQTAGKAREFATLLADPGVVAKSPTGANWTRRDVIIDLANRKREALNALVGLRHKPITIETIRRDLSLTSYVLAQATDALKAGAHRSEEDWRTWVETQERVIERLRQLREEQRETGTGRLEDRDGRAYAALMREINALAEKTHDSTLRGFAVAFGGGGYLPDDRRGIERRNLVEAIRPAQTAVRAASLGSAGTGGAPVVPAIPEARVPARVALREAVGSVQAMRRYAQLDQELERLSGEAQAFGGILDEILAGALFGSAGTETVASVQIFDLNEGVITETDLTNTDFLSRYFDGTLQHRIVVVVAPENVAILQTRLPSAYVNRIELIPGTGITRDLAARYEAAGYRVVVNTTQDQQVTPVNETDEILEISTVPEVFRAVEKPEKIRKAILLGGRNAALNGAIRGALEESGIVAPGGDYVRLTLQNLASLLSAITIEAEAEEIRQAAA